MSEQLQALHAATRRRHRTYDAAVADHRAYEAFAHALAARLPFRWHVVGAVNYTQCYANGYQNGQEHIVLDEAVDAGRIHRVAGDALCKPLAQFKNLWGERNAEDAPTCKRCLEIAERLIGA